MDYGHTIFHIHASLVACIPIGLDHLVATYSRNAPGTHNGAVEGMNQI